MDNQTTPSIKNEIDNNERLSEQERKYGKSIFKKWIYAKFDAKIILEIVEKDIYLNPKISILLPTLTLEGKKKFLSATLDLKSLQNLSKEIESAIQILEKSAKK